MSSRFLIINADDFGICKETNDAIEHLFQEGRITSTTVMIPCAHAYDALTRARKIGMNVGLHITLNSDFQHNPWSCAAPASKVPSLLDKEGFLHHDTDELYKNAKEEEVSVEIGAQYDTMLSLMCQPDHADSHCGTVYGLSGRSFLREAYALCAKYRLPFRLPKSTRYLRAASAGAIPPEIQHAHEKGIALADELGIPLITDMVTNPFDLTQIGNYDNLKAFYLEALRSIGEGVTELFLHPSLGNAQIMAVSPNWQKRIWEYQLLLDDEFMKTIEREGIQLVSWGNAPL